MHQRSVDAWLNISNVAALLLFAIVCLEVFVALAMMVGYAALGLTAAPSLCRELASLWPDRDATIALLNDDPVKAVVVLCATNLVPRIFYIGITLIGLVWMAAYYVVRISQTLFPLIIGDDLIRLFILAIGVMKFGTDRYANLADGRTSATLIIITYLLLCLVQALFIIWFQRRFNERTHIASRD